MTELIQEALGAHNLPLTLLLMLVIVYWMLVLIGAMHFDLDMFDFGDGGHVDLGHADAHGHFDGPQSTHLGAAWISAGRYLGFKDVPIVVWGSFLILFMWLGGLLLNYYYNGTPDDRSFGVSVLLQFPNFILSALATKIVTIPVGRVFAALSSVDAESVALMGSTGTVVSMEADETYGQLEIPGKSSSALINVRLRPGSAPLKKGALATVVAASPDASFYIVEPRDPPPPLT